MSTLKGSIIVTGANGGLGAAIVDQILGTSELAAKYHAVYTVRKAATASKLNSTLQRAPASHKHQIRDLDLSSLASVKGFAEEVKKQVSKEEIPPIRSLILNAAYQDHQEIAFTKDGFETTWQVNYLANLVLILSLLQSMDKKDGRILIVGSWSHDSADPRNNTGGNKPFEGKWQNIFPGPEELAKGKWSTPQQDPSWLAGYRRYGASKLCAVMLMEELGHRLARDPQLSRISSIGLDPGVMSSDLTRRGDSSLKLSIKWVVPVVASISSRVSPNGIIRTPTKSARDVINACFQREIPQGKPLYLNGSEEHETATDVKDDEKRKALWTYGVQAASIGEGDTVLADWK